jgi:hypothetical protein
MGTRGVRPSALSAPFIHHRCSFTSSLMTHFIYQQARGLKKSNIHKNDAEIEYKIASYGL